MKPITQFINTTTQWVIMASITCNIMTAQSYSHVADEHLPRPMVINPALQWTRSVDVPEHQGMPYQLSFDRISDGPPSYIWSSYRDGGEELYMTSYRNGLRSRSHLISAGKGI